MRIGALLALPAAAVLALSACAAPSSEAGRTGGNASTSATGELSGTLTVFAAASLTDVFEQLGEELTAEHPDLEIRFNFAGSSALATQIVQGAPADVFASADRSQMAVVTDAGLAAGKPRVFTENVLVIAVPRGNPGGVTGIGDFAREELALAVCAPDVPCGAASEEIFELAGVDAAPDTLDEDVRAALTKVELGEVDAALVYASDVAAAGDAVEGVAIPEAGQAINEYPICVLADAPDPEAAEAFLELVASETGQAALEAAGFRSPS